ncbi:MAG: hypothetical protein HQK59_07275 [Deltaproteobacteria bacterium]|nr:hypothetical protein [Deltaproteobacteria bacterium]
MMLSFQQAKSLESVFGPQSTPLIEVLEAMGNQVATNLSSELATKADFAEIKGSINTLREMSKRDIEEVKGEMKRIESRLEGKINTSNAELKGMIGSLENELKGTIGSLESELKGMIGSLENKFEGSINTLRETSKKDVEEVKGELKSIRLLMKTLIGLVIFGISFFSPVGVKLVEFALKGIK